MSGDIVNLRRARKNKRRVAADAEAAANRVLFGVNRIERDKAALERRVAARVLDGALRDRDTEAALLEPHGD